MLSLDCVKNILNSNQAERTFVVGLTMLSRFSHNFSCVACGVKSIHYVTVTCCLTSSRGEIVGEMAENRCKSFAESLEIFIVQFWFSGIKSRKTTTFRHLKDSNLQLFNSCFIPWTSSNRNFELTHSPSRMIHLNRSDWQQRDFRYGTLAAL